jgi:hypothetical protein
MTPAALAPELYCDVCACWPCETPGFCELARISDRQRLRKQTRSKPPTVEEDFNTFAKRARDMAAEWRVGAMLKVDAVDRSYNLACALGLHYRASEDLIQRVLVAAFRGLQS